MLLAAGCLSAQKITVEFDQTADFTKYHTFAIRDGKLNSKNPALNSELVKKQIETDIQKDLTARGLEQSGGKAGDLNVVYHFGSARKMQVERYPAGWRGFGTRLVRVPYTEGTLVIDLRDPTTKSLVWRGIATQEKGDASKLEGKLDDMVRKALEKYPPKPAGLDPPDDVRKTSTEANVHREHHRNFYDAVRSRKPHFEDGVFGFRAAGPALLTNTSLWETRICGWDGETMTAS